jgi:hypothetical protein
MYFNYHLIGKRSDLWQIHSPPAPLAPGSAQDTVIESISEFDLARRVATRSGM